MRLCFVGLLKLDGQKTIWLEQLRRLPRDRFSPRFVTFSDEYRRGFIETELLALDVPLARVPMQARANTRDDALCPRCEPPSLQPPRWRR